MAVEEPFDLVSLRLLVAVGARSSIGKAARDLGLSQPSASIRLAALERRIGAALVERSPAGSRLTADGEVVADWARQVVDASDVFANSVRTLRQQHAKRLTVAASKTIGEHLMPWWLVALHSSSSEVSVALDVDDTARVVERVRGGLAELGFIEGAQALRGLRSRHIGDDELVVAVAPQHPLRRRRRPLTPQHLADIPLLLREPGCGSRSTLEKGLATHGLRPKVAAEVASTTTIKALVAAGDGVTVLSSLAVAPEVRAGRLVALPLADAPLRLLFRAIWRTGSRPTPPCSELLAIAAGATSQQLARPRPRRRRDTRS